MDGITVMRDPGTGGDVQMRIGCHSGGVVAGVVGNKMPRQQTSESSQLFQKTNKCETAAGTTCSG